MLQTEFEERVGKRVTPEQYSAIEKIYMAAEPLNKDVFCSDWKKHNGSAIINALMHQLERQGHIAESERIAAGNQLQAKNEQLDAMRAEQKEMARFLIDMAYDTSEAKLAKKAIEILGEAEYISTKIDMKLELDGFDFAIVKRLINA